MLQRAIPDQDEHWFDCFIKAELIDGVIVNVHSSQFERMEEVADGLL